MLEDILQGEVEEHIKAWYTRSISHGGMHYHRSETTVHMKLETL